jgi:hypothetical protein
MGTDCMYRDHIKVGIGLLHVEYGAVELRVLEVLKGTVRPGAHIYTFGQVDDPSETAVRTAVEAYRWRGNGRCFANDYRREAEYILFLRDAQLVRALLAPINSEVDGPDDPWVVWIRARLAGSAKRALH